MMKYGLFFLMLITLLSCGKDDSPRIAEVYVNFPFTVQDFSINSKDNKDGVWLVDKQGVAGLIIVKTLTNTYKAFDRCSSVDPDKKCAVVTEGTYIASDPCSGGKWFLLDGSPQKAPAVRNLKEYQVRIINGFNLLVTNDYGN